MAPRRWDEANIKRLAERVAPLVVEQNRTPVVPSNLQEEILSNKTINLADNTISGTAAEFDTALSDDSFLFASDIGVDVQAYDAELASWAGVARASGFDTFAATPSSANLRALLTDETGTGAAVFATAPTLSNPVVGTQSARDNSTKAASTAYVDGATRERLTADRTYYVRPADGSDSNTGLVNNAGGAFATYQKALDVVYGTLDLAGYNVTIQAAASSTPNTTTAALSLSSPQVGKGTVTLLGDTTTPSNFVISTSGTCIVVSGAGAALTVRGFKLTSSAAYAMQATQGGRISYGKIEFGSVAQYHLRADNAGSVSLVSGDTYSISGGGAGHIVALSYGLIAIASTTVTLTGTPAWSVAGINMQGAQISLFNVTFSGSATGSRYSVTLNGVINSFGAGTASTYFPGNSNGTTSTGGQQA